LPAEIIAVGGALAGNRYILGEGPFEIGRSPSASLPLADPALATRHCAIRTTDGEWHIAALSPGHTTYVNGLRIKEQRLEDNDQISVGENDFIFRRTGDSSIEAAGGSKTALLRACSLLFLFRALVTASADSTGRLLEGQIIRLIGDVVPVDSGVVLLAKGEADLARRAAARGIEPRDLCARLSAEGPVVEAERGSVTVPIYARGNIAGLIQAHPRGASIPETVEVLSAIAVLAAAAIESAREVEALRNENALLLDQIHTDETGLIGESPAMQRLKATIGRVAPRDATILILGESGTGKELIARALHNQSGRHGPFVAVNCAALSDNLLESELFGHEKGAFTGAVSQKKGKLEMAERGTIFLDEIGELAPGLQAKMLRVLQEREFDRVGGTQTLRLDVRVIAATNRDLGAEAKRGAFREDLYHRLNVVALRTTPLRERPEDIPLLSSHFLQKAAARCKRRVQGFSPEAMRLLRAYPWPGNVRELENAIERAVVLGATDMTLPEDLPDTVLDSSPGLAEAGPAAFQSSVGSAKRESIIRAWNQAKGDYKTAAALLELHPNSLLRLIRTLGLRDVLNQR
jgi:Nif-specific regulatory protein